MKNSGEVIPEEFYNYITEPVTPEDMRLWVRHKNIDVDRDIYRYTYIDIHMNADIYIYTFIHIYICRYTQYRCEYL